MGEHKQDIGTLGETTCRACMSQNMFMFLDLGMHPPANQFLKKENLEREEKFPLPAHTCLECGLIQIPDYVPADFFRDYLYVPSFSTTMHKHFGDYAKLIQDRFINDPSQQVLDIGCNDGLLLIHCQERGLATLGIDPAANLSDAPRAKGIEILNEYFGAEMGQEVRQSHGAMQVITTSNTFNHIDDLHSFMSGVKALLADDGAFIVEVPQALTLVENNEFDTIYLEHVSEFSVKSFIEICKFFDMVVFDVKPIPVHGGSMRVFMQHKDCARPINTHVDEWLDREHEAKLFERETYVALAKRVNTIRDDLLSLITRLKGEGKSVAGYGAPAKSCTLLNYYGIGPEHLDYLADKSTMKQGLYSPGMHIPIVSPSVLEEQQPDYVIILAWNFADEIIAEQTTYQARGGKFILPIPEPRIFE